MHVLQKTIVILAALSVFSNAQFYTTAPVGFETVSYESGFNHLGLRFLGKKNAATGVSSASGTTITLDNAPGDGDFIFEISGNTGDGIVTTATVTGTTATTADDISGAVDSTSEVTLREFQTLEKVFGDSSSTNLAGAAAAPNADQVWIPDGNGGFSKYYVYSFFGTTEWRDVDTNSTIDPQTIDLVYPDGVVISAVAANDFTVAGALKLGKTTFSLTSGFNYVSTVYPEGLTLAETEFIDTFQEGLAPGGSDQLWIPDGNGGFDKFYVYSFFGSAPEWRDVDTDTAIDATTVSISSPGAIIQRGLSSASNVTSDSPDFYDSL